MRILRTLIPTLLVLTNGCTPSATPPGRPARVPDAATWAGGPDGGAWFVCGRSSDSATRFECTVYNDSTGEIWATGNFELRQVDSAPGSAHVTMPTVTPSPLGFAGFDGRTIFLDGSYILLPDGELEFPFGPGWGKRQKFKLGEEIGPEAEYGTPAG